jgi:hypothetical protein
LGETNSIYKYDNEGFRLDSGVHYVCARVKKDTLWSKMAKKLFIVSKSNTLVRNIEMVNNTKLFNYPNPFTNSTTIKLSNNDKINRIEIYNLTGSVVKTINNVNSSECIIYRENLANGLYYIKVNASNSYVLKMVIQ